MYVVPRKGDVDRNLTCAIIDTANYVVPRKGDVDRNSIPAGVELLTVVVPRKGDVDRNNKVFNNLTNVTCRPPQGGRG